MSKSWEELDAEEQQRQRQNNNPNNSPTGAYTGRCARCGSSNLWDDMTMYGCNECDAMYSNTEVKVVPR